MTEVMNIKKNSKGDDAAVRTSILFNSAALCIIVAMLSCLRQCFPLVYANNVCQHVDGEAILPEPHSSWFGWVFQAANLRNEQVMDTAGLDALMFIEYLRMFRRFFFYAGSLTAVVLCPVHYYLGALKNSDLLTAVGIGSVADTEIVPNWCFWLHAAFVWCILGLALRLVFDTHHRFLNFRFKWLMQIPEPRSVTLLVENIPRSRCSDEALRNYFAHLFGQEAVERAYVVRHTPHLRAQIKKLKVAQERLLLAQQAWAKEGYDPDKAPKVTDPRELSHSGQPAIEFYMGRVEALRAAVEQERQRVELAVRNHDPYVCCCAGFVTFTSRRWCRLALREQYTHDSTQMVVSMPPDPADVLYRDLAKDPSMQADCNIFASFCMWSVMLVWIPMVGITSSLTSLDSLQTSLPWLKIFCNHFPRVKTLLQGLLASFALKFLMSLLPAVLMTIIRQIRILKAGTWAQLRLQNRLFSFEIVFVLFIVTLGSSISGTLRVILDHPQHTVVILATSLPQVSHFYLNYVILGWFTVALEFSRYWNCLMFLCQRLFWNPEIARQKSEPEDQVYYGMGARMAKIAVMATLAVVFMQVLPVIGLVTWVFFGISSIFYSYLMVFAETRKPDLGGEFWVASVRHTFFALLIYVLLMTGTLSLKAEGRYAAGATVCSIFLLFLAWQRFKQLNWEILPFETVAEMDYSRKVITQSVGMYIQPECCRDENESDRAAGVSSQHWL